MKVITKKFKIEQTIEPDMVDITDDVQNILSETEMKQGNATIFVSGSTAAITTIEYEPGLKHDFPSALDRLFPKNMEYKHNATWGDGNGYSHVRASFLSPSLTVPFQNNSLILGTWQQIILQELDNKPRRREITVQFIGE
jgi:secondary thiamine-phosphate synthase enzyme